MIFLSETHGKNSLPCRALNPCLPVNTALKCTNVHVDGNKFTFIIYSESQITKTATTATYQYIVTVHEKKR